MSPESSSRCCSPLHRENGDHNWHSGLESANVDTAGLLRGPFRPLKAYPGQPQAGPFRLQSSDKARSNPLGLTLLLSDRSIQNGQIKPIEVKSCVFNGINLKNGCFSCFLNGPWVRSMNGSDQARSNPLGLKLLFSKRSIQNERIKPIEVKSRLFSDINL